MKLTIYRIFSFLLLPIAILFGIGTLALIPAAFSNPAMLFPLFLIACISIYSFTALYFLIKGIDGKKFVGKTSKDLLKINALASAFFSVMIVSECIIFLLHPQLLQQYAIQSQQNAPAQLKFNGASIENYMRICTYFFLVYGVVLFIHVLISFQYIKLYSHLFQKQNNSL